MNATDRKLITEYLATVAQMAEIPYPKDYGKDGGKRADLVSTRLIQIAGQAEWVASDPAEMMWRMGSAIDMMRKAMAKPLPFEQEPPEYLDKCTCGEQRSAHSGPDMTGPAFLAVSHPDKYTCEGFTLATTTPEGIAS